MDGAEPQGPSLGPSSHNSMRLQPGKSRLGDHTALSTKLDIGIQGENKNEQDRVISHVYSGVYNKL